MILSPDPIKVDRTDAKIFIFFILSLIGGVIFSCVFEYFSGAGYFQKWETVGTVPENTAAVVNGSPNKVYIQTKEKKIVSCNFNSSSKDECWIPDVVLDLYSGGAKPEPCSPKYAAFFSTSRPPKNLTSCVYYDSGGEAGYEVIYAVGQDHTLWRWEIIREGGETELILMMMVLGGWLGLFLFSIIWIIVRLARIKKLSERPLFPAHHVLLLAIPWICLLSFLALRFFID